MPCCYYIISLLRAFSTSFLLLFAAHCCSESLVFIWFGIFNCNHFLIWNTFVFLQFIFFRSIYVSNCTYLKCYSRIFQIYSTIADGVCWDGCIPETSKQPRLVATLVLLLLASLYYSLYLFYKILLKNGISYYDIVYGVFKCQSKF